MGACGPAYIYYLTQAFEEILNEWQSDRALSRQLAVGLFKGASVAMEREGEHSLQDLIAGVTSEKGVTMEAIASYQRDNLKGILRKGVERAGERLIEIKNNNHV